VDGTTTLQFDNHKVIVATDGSLHVYDNDAVGVKAYMAQAAIRRRIS
jgi:uncharacterized phage-like protein YoqJ